MNSTLEKQIINKIWLLLERIRGIMDFSYYKEILLPLFFYKHICDAWSKYNDNSRKTGKTNKHIVIPNDCSIYDLCSKIDDDSFIERLENNLKQIEETNREILEDVFTRSILNYIPHSRLTETDHINLRQVLDTFCQIDFEVDYSKIEHFRIIGRIFSFLLDKFADLSKYGYFMTPLEISHLLALLLQPKTKEEAYDPAIGTGTLILNLLENLETEDLRIFGQEKDVQTWAICKMNMIIHLQFSSEIELGDTLIYPKFNTKNKLRNFDIVVSSPPFSVKDWRYDVLDIDPFNRFHRGMPPKSNADYAFISHMIESMKADGGRMGILVSHGVLFKERIEGEIRKKIIEENLIDTVIGLPEKLMYGTSIPTAILLLKKNRKSSEILFIDASKEYQEDKRQNKLREENIQKIISTQLNRKEIKGYSHLADLEEINKNDYNLNISLYVYSTKLKEKIDIKWAIKEIEQTEYELNQTRKRTTELIKELYEEIKE